MLTRLLFGSLLVASASLSSCQKQDIEEEVRPTTQSIQDSWTWAESKGGFSGMRMTPTSTGNQQQVEFNTDGTFRQYSNGQLVRTDTYTITVGTSKIDFQTLPIIHYGRGLDQSAIVSSNHLTLRDEAADGQVHEYQR
jgi:hypothetical protein